MDLKQNLILCNYKDMRYAIDYLLDELQLGRVLKIYRSQIQILSKTNDRFICVIDNEQWQIKIAESKSILMGSRFNNIYYSDRINDEIIHELPYRVDKNGKIVKIKL